MDKGKDLESTHLC